MTTFASTIARLYGSFTSLSDLGRPAALLAARLLIARAFLLSGLTKWDGPTIKDTTFDLFRTEFFGAYSLPGPLVDALAVGAAVGEIVLPVLLIVGLFTRFAAIGLGAMTAVIQLLVYPDAWWTVHAWWAAVLLAILAFGPGAWSLDRVLGLESQPAQSES
jgi:putative oxidoreductase